MGEITHSASGRKLGGSADARADRRDKLLELVAREEDGYGPPYGRALDIGTGSAVWGVRLAERGWEVTGIDIVEKALHRARARVEQAGVEMHLLRGDVTALREADTEPDPIARLFRFDERFYRLRRE